MIYSTTEGGGSTLTPGISGGSGQGASFRVKTISSVETVSLNTDTIEGMRNVRLTSDPFSADPFIDNTVATTLASANVNTTLVGMSVVALTWKRKNLLPAKFTIVGRSAPLTFRSRRSRTIMTTSFI